jgi:hypothetical protein
MKHYDTKLTAAALLFKLHRYARELESKDNRTNSDSRKLLAIKAGALVTENRIRTNKATLT